MRAFSSIFLFIIDSARVYEQASIPLKEKISLQLESHLLVMLKRYGTSSRQNCLLGTGSSKMAQLAITARASMEIFREIFPELHVRLISLPVTTSFGVTPK
jgi:hypothetical protein